MRSSTFSSSRRIPKNRWVVTWATGALLFVVALTAWELVLRSHGIEACLLDDANLWCLARDNVNYTDHTDVVIVGSSRILAGLNLEVIQQRIGDRFPAQLAIGHGQSPIPVLRQIAEDTKFRGVMVCGVTPSAFFCDRHRWENGELKAWGMSEEYTRYYKQWQASYACRFDAMAGVVMRSRFSFLRPEVDGRRLIRCVVRGEFPSASPFDMNRERNWFLPESRSPHAARKEAADTAVRLPQRPLSDHQIDLLLNQLRTWVEGITSRGGVVVFVRMPSTGGFRIFESQEFPRVRFWDRLAGIRGAVAIHFEDYPSLTGYTCVDTSHLSGRDAVAFTRAFCDILGQSTAGIQRFNEDE